MTLNNYSITSQNWTRLSNTGTSGTITAVEVANGTLYYGTSGGGLYRMENAKNGTPSPVNMTSNSFPSGNVVCIQADPSNSSELFVVFSNYGVRSVFHSTNAGSSWPT